MAQKLFIISGPSGAGEDSVIDGLKKILPIERVITTTTRAMRKKEMPGNPYYFISKDEFMSGIASGKFFEYAQEYNDSYYGVTNEEIKRVKNSKKIGIWKIAYKGVISAKAMLGDEVFAILVNAPLEILEQRIRNRDNASEEFIKERMDYTKEWLKHKDIYDCEVENEQGKLEKTIKKVADIIKKEAGISTR